MDELTISFTHAIKMDPILSGIELTGRRVEAVFFVIVGIEGRKDAYERILWDQVSALVQLGLLDPKGLPVVGADAVAKLRNPALPDPFFNEGELPLSALSISLTTRQSLSEQKLTRTRSSWNQCGDEHE